jgi:hypothetical protein
MTESPMERARAACEALCAAYAAMADASRADDFAALFTIDGVFDRMGTELVGRDAIRAIIAGRPPGTWSKHVNSNLRITVAADGRSATGTCDLAMERGIRGDPKVERLRGAYADQYALTGEGWRFRRRAFRLAN